MNRYIAAIVVPLAMLAGPIAAPPAGATPPRCAKTTRTVPVRLPAAVDITTRCAVYTISTRGSVRVKRRPGSPQGITWTQMAGPGAQVVSRGNHVAVLRAGREVWRSSERFRSNSVFALLGPRSLAFSYNAFGESGPILYVAPFGGSERKIADGEGPLGWTADDELLTWRFRHGSFGLFLRGTDGSLVRRVGAGIRELRFELSSGTALALTRAGHLERYDGRWHRLADLRTLDFGKHVSFEPLASGLIGVIELGHVAVLRRDGTLFASARLPAGRRTSVAGQSGLIASPSGNAVAFTVTRGNDGSASVGRESVVLLRAGDRAPREIYRGSLRFAVCERFADLAWHGPLLLYATTEGRTFVFDTRAATRRIDLTHLVARFSSTNGEGKIGAQVRWAG